MPSPQPDDSRKDAAAPELPSTSFGGGETTLRLPDAGGPETAASVPAAETPRNFGRYLVVQVLGNGAFGVVYRGYDPQLARDVAIKAPRESKAVSREALAEFEAEARVLASLAHSGIVPVYDFGVSESGRCYLVAKFVDGVNLARAMSERRFTPREAALLAAAVAEALHYAHKLGVLHRDVKPANILLATGDVPLLADFGLALREAEQRERAGEQSGTPAYMSPEQARGEAHRLDGRTDIWSLGAVLYELLTGRKPFAGETLPELFDEIEHREPKPPRQIDDAIPAALERICLRALAKRLADRFTTAQDMADELRRAVAELDAAQGRPYAPAQPLGPHGEEALVDENVQFTVFRPKTMRAERPYRLLAFAHLGELPESAPLGTPEPQQEVRDAAAQELGSEISAYAQTVQDSGSEIPRWGELTFVPEAPGVTFYPAQVSFTWRGKTHKAAFSLHAAKSLAGSTARGRLNVFLGAVLIAEVPLNLRVSATRPDAAELGDEIERGRRYRKIYAAYSAEDKGVVEQLASYAAALGDEYVSACARSRAALGWSEELSQRIREADVFQLFWSSHSMRSPLVQQEWECALALARQDFVRPIYWEEPCPTDAARNLPPPELKRLAFTQIGALAARASKSLASPPADENIAELKARLAADLAAKRGEVAVRGPKAAPNRATAEPLDPVMKTLNVDAIKAQLQAKRAAEAEGLAAKAKSADDSSARGVRDSAERFEENLAAQLERRLSDSVGDAAEPRGEKSLPSDKERTPSKGIHEKLRRVRSARNDQADEAKADPAAAEKSALPDSGVAMPTSAARFAKGSDEPPAYESGDSLTASASDFVANLGTVGSEDFVDAPSASEPSEDAKEVAPSDESEEERVAAAARFTRGAPAIAAALKLVLGCILLVFVVKLYLGFVEPNFIARSNHLSEDPPKAHSMWPWHWGLLSVAACLTTLAALGAWRTSGAKRIAFSLGCGLAAALVLRTLYVMFF